MNPEDAISDSIREGIAEIYENYATGKKSLDATCTKLGDFLDSKGVENAYLDALIIVKNWRR